MKQAQIGSIDQQKQGYFRLILLISFDLKINDFIFKLMKPTVILTSNILETHSDEIYALKRSNQSLKRSNESIKRSNQSLKNEINHLNTKLDKLDEREQFIKISDYFKYILKFYTRKENFKLENLYESLR